MSGMVRHRSRWRRWALRLALAAAFVLATTALAGALQVRTVRVAGASRFPASDVEAALAFALGTPTVAMPAEALRNAVRAVPWVADARVSVTIDGVVSCTVSERVPVATAVDGTLRAMVDAEGELLGPPRGILPALELVGFAADPVGRAALLAARGELEKSWGAALVRAERVGPRDVLLSFADSGCSVLCDPGRPQELATARQLLSLWTREEGAPPLRLDVRVPGRVAVLPAPAPAEPREEAS